MEKTPMKEKAPKAPSTSGMKASASLAGNLTSSPPRIASAQSKERRKASVTPRKFQRFFTPRSRVSSQSTAAGRALSTLTASALNNRCHTPSSPLKPISEHYAADEDDLAGLAADRGRKRRKMQHTPETSPLRPRSPSPSARNGNASPALSDLQLPALPMPRTRRSLLSPIRSLNLNPVQKSQDTDLEDAAIYSGDEDMGLPLLSEPVPLRRPVPLPDRGMAAQLLQRMTGGMPRGGHQQMRCPVADWRMETADFQSKPEDVHMCTSHEGAARCIPFCVASCNSKFPVLSTCLVFIWYHSLTLTLANTLVAVGDEEGYVRILDTDKTFDKVYLSFPVHSNAIIDLAFSDDDTLLATASGDQTGKVIDMVTQTPISVLGHHSASLKQIRFQPGRGSNSVLATSSRDGSVQIWDLRCRGGPAVEIHDPVERDASLGYRAPRTVNAGCVVNSIYGAHKRPSYHRYQTRQSQIQNIHTVQSLPSLSAATSTDVGHRGEVPGRIGEVSVTAIQFLPPGREHLLLSASEADATIKLWDIRSVAASKSLKNHHAVPVSHTSQPYSHLSWRPFGIAGLTLSSDGARLYALCKDNTVYAYSTAHLVLGHAPELSSTAGSEPPRRHNKTGIPQPPGLGPMYGFRHPSFHATSFYVKAAIRPARDGKPEMLAVGSSDNCAVVFPTDERYFRRDLGAAPDDERLSGNPGARFSSGGGRRAGLVRTNSVSNLSARLSDTIPILKPYGTALVRGHDKEVGALSWSSGGKLVTVGDDYLVRCWSEDREKASDLRRGGESGGRRWACGWADVGESWEGDEDDW